MAVADLHVHTTRSDGHLSLAGALDAAREAGLAAVALTDHDRVQPSLAGPVVERDGLLVVHGIELRVESPAGRVDLLGYGVDPTPALREECARIQRDRRERGARIIDCVEQRLGVSLPVEPRPGLGRPHVARAVAAVTDHDPQWAFDELIGDGGPCYVAREVTSFERGRELLAEACALVGLAHPLRYDDPEAALSLCAHLDAVERAYPYGADVDLAPVRDAIDRYDLVATGGSDAHGERVGTTGLDAEEWAAVRERLPAPA